MKRTLATLALLAAFSVTQAGAVKEPPPTFAITRSADFDRDGCVSFSEVLEVAARFGTQLGGAANNEGYHYSIRYDVYIPLRPVYLVVSISDVIQAASQMHARPCP